MSQITHVTEPVVLDRTAQKINDNLEIFIKKFSEGVSDVKTDVKKYYNNSEGSYIVHESVVKTDPTTSRLYADFIIPWNVDDLQDGSQYMKRVDIFSTFLSKEEAVNSYATKLYADQLVSSCKDELNEKINTITYTTIPNLETSLKVEIRTQADTTKQEMRTEIAGSYYNKSETTAMLDAKQDNLTEAQMTAIEAMGHQNLSEAEIKLLKELADNSSIDHKYVTQTQIDSWNATKNFYAYITSADGSITITPSYDSATGITAIDLKAAQALIAGKGIEIGTDGSINLNIGDTSSTSSSGVGFNSDGSMYVKVDGSTLYVDPTDGKIKVASSVGKVKDVQYADGMSTSHPYMSSCVGTDGVATFYIPRNIATDFADSSSYKTYNETVAALTSGSGAAGFYTKQEVDRILSGTYASKTYTQSLVSANSINKLTPADETITIYENPTTGLYEIGAVIDTYDVKVNGGLNRESAGTTPEAYTFSVNVDDKTVKIGTTDNKLFIPIDNSTIKYNATSKQIYTDSTKVDYSKVTNKPTINGVELDGAITIPTLLAAGDNVYYSDGNKKINAKDTTYGVELNGGLAINSATNKFYLDAKTSDLKANDGDGVKYKSVNVDPYSKKSETGSKIDLTFDSAYNLQAQLSNSFNDEISTSTTIALPLESMVMDAEFIVDTEGVKWLTITLKNGKVLKATLSEMLGGLENTINRVNTVREPGSADKTKYTSEYAVSTAVAGKQDALPTGVADYYLHVKTDGTLDLEWAPVDSSNAVFYATYGTTPLDDILDAYADEKAVYCVDNGQIFQLSTIKTDAVSGKKTAEFVMTNSNGGNTCTEKSRYCTDDTTASAGYEWGAHTDNNIQWQLTAGTGIEIINSPDVFHPLIRADGTATALVDDVKLRYHAADPYTSILDSSDKTAYIDLDSKQDTIETGDNLFWRNNKLNAKDTTYTGSDYININKSGSIEWIPSYASSTSWGVARPDSMTIYDNWYQFDSEGNYVYDYQGNYRTLGEGVLSVPYANGGKGRGPLGPGIIIPDEKTVSVNKLGVLKALAAPNSMTFYTNDITFKDDEDKKIAYKATIAEATGATGAWYLDVINHLVYAWDGVKWQLINSFQNASASNTYTLTTSVSPDTSSSALPTGGGSISGGGTYVSGTAVTCTATADAGYKFKCWEDGTTDATRTVTITADTFVEATFVPIDYYVTTAIVPNHLNCGSVSLSGGKGYVRGETCTMTATPNTDDDHGIDWTFSKWSDDTTTNPKSWSVTADADYTAVFNYEVCNGSVTRGTDSTLGYVYYDVTFKNPLIVGETYDIVVDGTTTTSTYAAVVSTAAQSGYCVKMTYGGVEFIGSPHKTDGAATRYSTMRFAVPTASAPSTTPSTIIVRTRYTY